jgi:hypothetical protein
MSKPHNLKETLMEMGQGRVTISCLSWMAGSPQWNWYTQQPCWNTSEILVCSNIGND